MLSVVGHRRVGRAVAVNRHAVEELREGSVLASTRPPILLWKSSQPMKSGVHTVNGGTLALVDGKANCAATT
eukprot:5923461-Pyramimonas_sp.AAC.1